MNTTNAVRRICYPNKMTTSDFECIVNRNIGEQMTYDFHKQFPESGIGKQYPWLLKQMQKEKHWELKSVLDYGAGKGGTAQWLREEFPGIFIETYDPSFNTDEEWRQIRNRYYDLVYSCDVLEHVPRAECIAKGGPLAWCNSCSRGPVLLIIDLTKAKKTLPSGENAHVNLQSPEQWIKDIELWMEVEHWEIDTQLDKTYGERNRLCVVAKRGKKM